MAITIGRTPHGVRGLKYDSHDGKEVAEVTVAPLTGCVD